MNVDKERAIVRRIAVAYAIYSLFWLVLIGLSYIQVVRLTGYGTFAPLEVTQITIVTFLFALLFYAVYFSLYG
jgi:hypothetical protein